MERTGSGVKKKPLKKKPRKNGRRKGACGEREAAAFLSRYLLPDGTPVVAKRMARNGQKGPADLEHNIPGVHFEVKRREAIDIGTKALLEALLQSCADGDPMGDSKKCVVLWRPGRRPWRITEYVGYGGRSCLATYDAHEWLSLAIGCYIDP